MGLRELASKTVVIICGKPDRIPESEDLSRRLDSAGYQCAWAETVAHASSRLQEPGSFDRVIILSHFPSFTLHRADSRGYQELLREYAELKADAGQNGITTNLIVFSYRDAGPVMGGWDCPITAYVVQEIPAILNFVQRVGLGTIHDYVPAKGK